MLQTITEFLKRLKHEKKGLSNVIVVMLTLVLIVIIVSNVVLWGYQMNQLDLDRSQEKIQITRVSYTLAGEIRIDLENIGPVSAHVVAFWISNSTTHDHRIDADLYTDVGQAITYVLNYPLNIGTSYVIKAVTERGNIAVFPVEFYSSNGAMIAYGEGTVAKFRQWNGISWGLQEDSIASSSNVEWIILKSSSLTDEKTLGVLTSAGTVDLTIWNGDDQRWTEPLRVADVGTTIAAYRLYDIAYEQQSGRAVAVYPSPTGIDLQYRSWNGSSWSFPQTIDLGTTGVVYWVKLAARPRSNEIALITLDSNRDVYGMIWNGTTWASGLTLENDASTSQVECIAVEYTQSSANAMFIWGSSASMYGRIWNGTSWEAGLGALNVGATCSWFSLKADPLSDRLAVASVDSASDLNTLRWNGTQWDLDAEHDRSVETANARCADIEFESLPGHEGHLVLVWGDSGVASITYKHFDGTNWSAPTQVSTSIIPSARQYWHVLRRSMNGRILLACMDNGNDINTGYWDGASWNWTNELEGAASTTSTQCFDLASDSHLKNTD
jgi:hypothetical protein